MVNSEFIRDKLEHIQSYYEQLEEACQYSITEIKEDFFKYRTVERLLQLIVDEMLDINNHFISRLKLRSPDDFQSTFKILADSDILPQDFATRIAPVVGLRNRLVHRYEKINLDLLLEHTMKEKDDFKEYIRLIEEYLKKDE